MNPLDCYQEDQLNDAAKHPNVLGFDEDGDASWYKIEGEVSYKTKVAADISHKKLDEPKTKDFKVSEWLEENRELTYEARGSYRLVVVENSSGHPTKFPIMKGHLNLMLNTWGFPPLHEILHAIRYGGSAVFQASPNSSRKNFLIGGGVFTHSIGAIFSYDQSLHFTTGCIILGKEVKWSQEARDEFRRSSCNDGFNPLSIPVLLAFILLDTLCIERDEFVNKIKQIEDKLQSNDYHSIFQDDVEETVLLQPKYYRSIFHGLSERQRDLGRIQMLIERNNLIMKFATETEQTWQGPQISIHLRERIKLIQSSVEFMSIEMKNLSGRLQSQVMIITNLISQQDIVLSTQISKDSTAIAVATRRDSVAMKIIAGVGTVFLPATLISAFLALLQLQWDAGKMAMVYFAITVPFTVLVLGVVWAFWRLLDEKLETKTYKPNQRREPSKYHNPKLTAPELIF